MDVLAQLAAVKEQPGAIVVMRQAAGADQRVDAASRTGEELGRPCHVEKVVVLATAPSLSDQLCGALRDPLDQLLGNVEGQRRHGMLSICVAVIALTVQAAPALHRLPGGLAAKVHHLIHIDILALVAYSGHMAQLMQVRQAARALGVHENTVRRWEEHGLLQAVRLPSGVRRFRAEDVEAMRAQMFSGFAPLREDDDVVPVTRARPID